MCVKYIRGMEIDWEGGGGGGGGAVYSNAGSEVCRKDVTNGRILCDLYIRFYFQ